MFKSLIKIIVVIVCLAYVSFFFIDIIWGIPTQVSDNVTQGLIQPISTNIQTVINNRRISLATIFALTSYFSFISIKKVSIEVTSFALLSTMKIVIPIFALLIIILLSSMLNSFIL